MTSITGTGYSGIYSYTNSSPSSLLDSYRSKSSSDTTSSSAQTGDTVTLSSGVATARMREYLGFSPTGRLTISDFEKTASEQEESVSSMLASTMEELGIDPDQQLSLSLDDDGQIAVGGKFDGKEKLQDALNSDSSFVQAFSGMSASNEIMDYADSLKNSSMSLASYMTSDTSDSDLLSLSLKYSTVKASGGSIESLLSLSHSETPFTYTYNGTEQS